MTVLVLGSTGTVGPHVVRALLAQGTQTRVIVRNGDKARQILGPAVEVIEGDINDPAILHSATDGVDALFLLTPHGNAQADLQLRVIRELRRTDIKIVKLSATSSTVHAGGPLASREHWEVEEILKASGQPFVILRPNAFMQSAINQVMLPAIKATGKLPNAIAQAGLSMIDAADVGDVAARVLTKPDWDGETIILTGPRAVTYYEIAKLVGSISGQEIEVVEITPADIRESSLARGVELWEAEHFEEMFQAFRDDKASFVTDNVELIAGHAPGTIEDYLARNADVFRLVRA